MGMEKTRAARGLGQKSWALVGHVASDPLVARVFGRCFAYLDPHSVHHTHLSISRYTIYRAPSHFVYIYMDTTTKPEIGAVWVKKNSEGYKINRLDKKGISYICP